MGEIFQRGLTSENVSKFHSDLKKGACFDGPRNLPMKKYDQACAKIQPAQEIFIMLGGLSGDNKTTKRQFGDRALLRK